MRLVAVIAVVAITCAAGHRPHGLRGGADPLGPVDDAGIGDLAAFVQPRHFADRHFGAQRSAGQLVDHLTAGVLGGRRTRPGQFRPDRGGESPVDRAADGELGRWGHVPHPHDRRTAASASMAVRPVGPALLEINAKVSTRPLASVTIPTNELVPVNEPGLRAQPARRRASGVGIEEAVGQRAAASGDGQEIHQRPQVRLVVARGGIDSLIEGLCGQPIVDGQPAAVHQVRTTCVDLGGVQLSENGTDGAVEALRFPLCGSDLPADRFRHHVVGVVHHPAQPLDQRRRLHRRDLVAVERRGQHRDGGRVDSQCGGQRATGVERGCPGPARFDADGLDAAAVEHHRFHRRDVTAVDVERVPARCHRRAAVRADVHLYRGHRGAAAPHLVGEIADAGRVPVPGLLARRCGRQRRVTATLEHHQPGSAGRMPPPSW